MIGRYLEKGRLIDPEYFWNASGKTRDTYYTLKKEGILHDSAEIDANGPPGHLAVADGDGPLAELFRVRGDHDPRVSEGSGRGHRGARGGSEAQAHGLTSEPTAAGEQTLAGVVSISERQRLETQAAKPLAGDDARAEPVKPAAEPSLFDAIPAAQRGDGADARLTTREAALAEAERTDFHADLVKSCKD